MTDSLDLEDDRHSILTCLLGDKARYSQILQNFLSNAVKFTSKDGEVMVVVTILEIQDVETEEAKNVMKKLFNEKLSSSKDLDIHKVVQDKTF